MQDSQVLRPAPAKRKQWRRASRSRHNLNDTIACLHIKKTKSKTNRNKEPLQSLAVRHQSRALQSFHSNPMHAKDVRTSQ